MQTGMMRWGIGLTLFMVAALLPARVHAQRRAEPVVFEFARAGAVVAAATDSLATRLSAPRVIRDVTPADTVVPKSRRSRHISTGATIGGVLGCIGGATMGGVLAWGGPGEHPNNQTLRIAGGALVGGVAGALAGAFVGAFLGSLVP